MFGRPTASAGRPLSGDLMSDFLIDLLNLCLVPFQRTDNLLIFIPCACLTISFLFVLVRRLSGVR